MEQSNAMKMDMRVVRAKKFATQIMNVLQDYLPADSDAQRRIHDHLGKLAYETNALIVNLPLEYDRLTELEAERKMIEKMLAPITVKATDVKLADD